MNPFCCRDTNRKTVSSMANYENTYVEPQTPESVLSVVDLEQGTSECVLDITEQKNGSLHNGVQCHPVNPELLQPLNTMLTGKMSVDLLHAEEVETKVTDSYKRAKTGTPMAPEQVQNSHNVKTDCKSVPRLKYSPNDRHPHVRRSYKNFRLNDPHAFSSPTAESSHGSSCGDTMGDPLLHSKQHHFIESDAEDAANLRCQQGNFKIPYGDQEVDGLSQESNILPAYLTACKERSLAIRQDEITNSKEMSEKGHRKKGCFQKLLEICCITKNKQKNGKPYQTHSEAIIHPISPPPVITITETENDKAVSRDSEKDAKREGHHSTAVQ